MARSRLDPFARAIAHAYRGRLREADAALEALPPSAALADERRWLRAYLLAAGGNFARAERDARTVLDRAVDPALRSRAAVTLGSILRQTGRHREGRIVETAAVREAPTPTDRAHLFIGLAADAVGLGELDAVDRALARAESCRAREPRVAIRLRWVRCERELLAGDPAAALRCARAALALSRQARARRHLAKSYLFAGAAARELARTGTGATRVRAEAEARRSLGRAQAIAGRIGARPIARVARDLLAASPGSGR